MDVGGGQGDWVVSDRTGLLESGVQANRVHALARAVVEEVEPDLVGQLGMDHPGGAQQQVGGGDHGRVVCCGLAALPPARKRRLKVGLSVMTPRLRGSDCGRGGRLPPAAAPIYLDFAYGHLGPVQWAVDDGAGEVGGDPVAFVFFGELFGLCGFAGEVERFDELYDE